MILVVRGKKNGKFVSFSVNLTTSKIHVFSKNGELGFVNKCQYRLELSDLSLQDTWYNHHNKYGCHPHRFLIIAGKFFDSDIETKWDYEFNDLMETYDESWRTEWANNLDRIEKTKLKDQNLKEIKSS